MAVSGMFSTIKEQQWRLKGIAGLFILARTYRQKEISTAKGSNQPFGKFLLLSTRQYNSKSRENAKDEKAKGLR